MKKWLRTLASALLVACMLATMLPLGVMAAEDTTVAIADADVLKLGRYYEKDGNLMFDWSNSGISFNFTGTGAKAVMTCSQMEPNPVYVNVYVDGAVVPNASFQLTAKAATEYVLAEGLTDGDHTITIRKRNEAAYGGSATLGINSLTILGGELTAAPTMPERRIEVIGDSITAGFGNLAANTDVPYNSHVSDGTSTYATLTAQALGAEIDVIARSGIRFVRAENNSHYTTYEMVSGLGNKCTDPYDFASNEKDVVIINLGTNDNGAKDENGNSVTDAYITSETVEFLKLIRKNNPNAEIIWAYGIMGSARSAAIQAGIAQYKTETEDTKVSYYALASIDAVKEGYGSGRHPNRITALNRSFGLTEYIAGLMNWNDYSFDAQLATQLAVTEGYDADYLAPYTEESIATLNTAIANAKALTNPTNAQVQAAVAAIQNANAGLTIDMNEVATFSTQEKSASGHYMGVQFDNNLTMKDEWLDHKLYLSYRIKAVIDEDCVNSEWAQGTGWAQHIRNGHAYLVDTNGTKTQLSGGLTMSAFINDVDEDGWGTVIVPVPTAAVQAGGVTSFQMHYYNDLHNMDNFDGPKNDKGEGDGGVTMYVTDIKLYATVMSYIDKSALEAALKNQLTADELVSYTAESASAYNKAFEDARKVYEDADAHQADINAAVVSLQTAESGLVMNTDIVAMIMAGERTSKEEHYLSLDQALTEVLDLTPYEGQKLFFSYEIRINTTAKHPDVNKAGWISTIMNGEMRLFSVPEKEANNDTAIQIGGDSSGKIHCGQNELAGIKANEWLTVMVELPDALWDGGQITKFHCYIYNDLHKADSSWDSSVQNAGVTLSLRNLKIVKESSGEVVEADKTDLNAAITEAKKITDLTVYTAESAAAFTAALTAAETVAAKENATQIEVDNATSALTSAKAALELKPVVTIVYGDVDGVEGVTVADALAVLQHVTGKITLTDDQIVAANVDGSADDNGPTVDVGDALSILQFVTGKIDVFPVEE